MVKGSVLSHGRGNMHRRQQRFHMRDVRNTLVRNQLDDRVGSRHRLCPRCSSRIRSGCCSCDSSHLDKLFSKREWNKLLRFRESCAIRTFDDCYDGNEFYKYMDLHQHESATLKLSMCWAYTRHQWPPTWDVLSKCFPSRGLPDFLLFEELLQGLLSSGKTTNNANSRKKKARAVL